jgi:hypothetical protein
MLMKRNFFNRTPLRFYYGGLFLIFNLFALSNALSADIPGKGRHSITPMLGITSNRNTPTPYVLSPGANLQIRYLNGDEMRMPLALRYDYRLKKGRTVGASMLMNYNPLYLAPAFRANTSGFDMFIGPAVGAQTGNLPGLLFHYSASMNFKLIKFFGSAGLGSYLQRPVEDLTADYSWYKYAPAEFYPFAVAATHQSTRRLLPITAISLGFRLKNVECSWSLHRSLLSPVKPFEYNGVQFENNIRFRSIGFYLGYRFEF